MRLLFGEPPSKNVGEFFWQMLWILIVGFAISYGSYLFFGTISIDGAKSTARIAAIDVVRAGEHHISGVVLVPSRCHMLSVKAQELSAFSYRLAFRTWQEPSRNCTQGQVAEGFNTIVFAPSLGVNFDATVNDTPVPFDLIPYYD